MHAGLAGGTRRSRGRTRVGRALGVVPHDLGLVVGGRLRVGHWSIGPIVGTGGRNGVGARGKGGDIGLGREIVDDVG